MIIMMKIKLDSLSPSSANRFIHTCPTMWMYRRLKIKGIQTDERPALYGKAIHNIIVLYFGQITEKPTFTEIEATVDKAFEEGENFAMRGFSVRTRRIKENFIEFEKKRLRTWKQYRPTFTEKWLEASPWDDTPPLRCIVDFYSRKDQIGLDWKTTRYEDIGTKNMIQGKINEIALKMNDLPIKKFMFFGLYHGRSLAYPRVTDEYLHRILLNMVNKVRKGDFQKVVGSHCKYCEYILNCQLENRCLWWGI